MRLIELDAQNWQSFHDYLDAMKTALGSPEWHGNNVDAFLDSMVWGGINMVEPPYTVRIKNTTGLRIDILEEIEILKKCIEKHRAESVTRRGYDVEVNIDIVP